MRSSAELTGRSACSQDSGALQYDKAAALDSEVQLDAAERPKQFTAQVALFERLVADDSDDYTEAQAASDARRGGKKRRTIKADPDSDAKPGALLLCAVCCPNIVRM